MTVVLFFIINACCSCVVCDKSNIVILNILLRFKIVISDEICKIVKLNCLKYKEYKEFVYIYRVSQEECAIFRESVPSV